MKEMYRHEMPLWMLLLGISRVNKDSIEFNWGYFAPRFGFELMLNRGGYFDQRYSIDICLIWGLLSIYLPFKTSIPESCDTPQYGVQIHHDTFWIHLGGEMNDWNQCDSKWITWELPWFSWVHDSHEVWAGHEWVKPFQEYSEPYSDNRLLEKHPYKYTLQSGEVQNRSATVYMERRKWHRKWVPFLPMERVAIDVTFDAEVGEETGTWKGGCTGCGYEMKEGETMLQTLRRMEAERKF